MRLAAGRARALGLPTRGTTNPNRLRRMDRWLVDALRATPPALVVDLGYGSSPVTTVELYARLRTIDPDVRVVGLELDATRVEAAERAADPPGLTFRRGGFELAGLRPGVVRAANVLRQYDEKAAAAAWTTLRQNLAPDGLLIDGTCDELGRIGGWVAVGPEGPRTLTFAVRLASLDRPSTLAERLPKALIHRNVPGERVHALLTAFDAAWDAAAPLAPFGPRQRWVGAVTRLRDEGWPVLGTPRRWRLGEMTLPWEAVAP
ncbi:class I SAM-dependent methyltransferase [Cryptosporangium phraense]|uniref:Class I SAM-dependent methyltransferase n=1 Tax=Cryptosporangium phraense TaxID=2593070 RepID=A0A545AHG1_9ACTN|nr:class I SAM-dependent methyltransferase [Cryptosporangium phraense]TQS40700.1 class I SAM-dependent methyltransferase [Cryptosporangium phraense]